MQLTSRQATLRTIIAETLCREPADLILDQSFLSNGGDSHAALQLVHLAYRSGINTNLALILNSPSLQSFVTEAQSRNASIHAPKRRDESDQNDHAGDSLFEQSPLFSQGESDLVDSYPLTDMQVALLSDTSSSKEMNVLYYVQELPINHLYAAQKAWAQVISEEPIFHSVFDLRAGCAKIFKTQDHDIPHVQSIEAEASSIDSIVETTTQWPKFPLPSMTTVFPKVGEKSSDATTNAFIVIHFHHATIDAFGFSLLKARVKSLIEGRKSPLSPPFSQVATRIREKQTEQSQKSIKFWSERSDLIATASHEPIIQTPSLSRNQRESRYQRSIVPIGQIEIDHVAKQHAVTPTTVVQAAWALTLAKATGNSVVGFGLVLSGRDMEVHGISATIGPTINVLPMYIRVRDDLEVEEFLQNCFQEQIGLLENQCSMPQHGFSRKLFSAINSLTSDVSDNLGILMSEIPVHLCMRPGSPLLMEVNTRMISVETCNALKHLFSSSLEAITRHKGKISDAMLLCQSKFSESELLKMGNIGEPKTISDATRLDLIDLFTTAANSNPSAIAVEQGDQSRSYHRLEVDSDRVANVIRSLAQPGAVVCVDADRSFEWITAIIGILKAGCVYCPLDTHAPCSVRQDIIEQSGAKVHLSGASNESKLSLGGAFKQLALRKILSNDISDPGHCQSTVHSASKLLKHTNAYLCFTSGSSGKPKGVINTHQSLVAFQEDLEVRLQARPGHRIAQLMSPVFDGSIHEIFSSLCYGATLVLKTSEQDIDLLKRVDSAIMTPSMASALELSEYPLLKFVYFVGEKVPQHVSDVWASRKTVYNMYGPSEAACGATIKRLIPGETVTLGVPNPSTRLYILNASHDRLLAAGFGGEICLAGVQVAAGYINKPIETRKSFKKDPFVAGSSERMYCTGDYGLWNENGEIVILHRKDSQVKVNGFRIDLEDLAIRVESAVSGCTAARVCLDNGSLAAFLKPKSLSADDVRRVLRERLPRYACPRKIMCVAEFPMTRNGKLDIKALHSPTDGREENPGNVQTAFEHSLADLWVIVLQLGSKTSIKPWSTLISLGGSSISFILLAREIERAFDLNVSLHALLASPSFLEMTRMLAHFRESDHRKKMLPIAHPSALSRIELGWWKQSRAGFLPPPFNVTFACRLPSCIDLVKLQQSIDEILARHSLLRARYVSDVSGDVRKHLAADSPQTIFRSHFELHKEINRSFELQKESPIRVLLSYDELLFVINHIVCDLTTLQTLLTEINHAYHEHHLEPSSSKTVKVSRQDVLPSNDRLLFWERYLNLQPEQIAGNVSRTITYNKFEGSSLVFKLPPAVGQDILKLSKSKDLTVHQIILGGAALALGTHTRDIDLIVGAPHMNRSNARELKSVGVFVQPLPIRIRHCFDTHSPGTAFEYMKHVQVSSNTALAHSVAWHKLTSHFGVGDDMLDQPFFDTMVSFHDMRKAPQFLGLDTQPRIIWTEGSKFKLMIEVTALSDSQVLLRMEYRILNYSIDRLQVIYDALIAALKAMCADASFEDLCSEVDLAKSGRALSKPRLDRTDKLFGITWQEVEAVAPSE
ncbi:MAG: hypothetical protein Q9159_000294 [Coniocarpon cinnabarinum]